MSDSTNSRPEGQGYNRDARSSSSPQVSSSLDASDGSGSSRPLQAIPLASRAPSSSRSPLQAKKVRAHIHLCGSKISEKDLVDLRARYDIPPSVMLRSPKATDRANAPPPGLRTFFCGVLFSLSPDRCDTYGEILPHLLLAAYSEGWLPLLHSEDRDESFCGAFSSKVEPDTWRPFFFYASSEGLPQGVPFGFMARPKSPSALPRSAKHKADAYAFSTYWGDKLPMPLHFYTDRQVLKDAGLSSIADADLGALEALRVSYQVPDSVPPPSQAAPTVALNQLPLRPPAPGPVEVSSSSEEDEALSPLLRRYLLFHGLTSFVELLVASILTWAIRHRLRPPLVEASAPSLHDAAPKSPRMGTNTLPSPEGHLSPYSPLPPANQVPSVTPGDAGGQHCATVVLEPED
ncbi:hypothetical protein LIER_07674 [Lithospermum erythrorhizon]|uniref:Uncharacterized protein n=1 Tax=Lithospermum erythrorhizon TaxID=34254 RepID=A0AAV3PAD6_LITER